VTSQNFYQIYADADLRDFLHDMARRLSPSKECAEDAESEAWLAIWQAPDGVTIKGLKDAIVTTVASAVWVERKPRRAAKRWVSLLREWTWNGAKMDGKVIGENIL
jgi:hypothetical protein